MVDESFASVLDSFTTNADDMSFMSDAHGGLIGYDDEDFGMNGLV